MAAMTRFDKIVLGLTAAFLVVTGGYFVSGQLGEAEYQVTVSKQVPAVSASLPEVEDGYPDSLLEGEVIDLNTASAADLTRLPGIPGRSGPRPSWTTGRAAAPSKAWKSSLR